MIRWTLGLTIASALVMGISPYFISNLRVYQWSDPIGDYVFKEGYTHRNRDEGWALSHCGPYGLNGAAEVRAMGSPTVLIWGDSYVEALQVNDDEKTASQFNEAFSPQDSTQVRAVSVGHAFWSVADYYYHMPSYEKLLNPAVHFIVLAEHGLKDLCPDEDGFRSQPQYEFVRRTLVDPRRNRITERLNQWCLADVTLAPWKAVRNLARDVRNMRFMVGPCETRATATLATGCAASVIQGEPNAVVAGWSYAIDRLKAATTRPIVLVLVPEVPYLEHGIVRLENPQVQWTSRLVDLCKARQVDLIDMTDVLVADYLATGQFSRGFNNGQPGSGHLNARGHLLLAQQIRAYLDHHPKGR